MTDTQKDLARAKLEIASLERKFKEAVAECGRAEKMAERNFELAKAYGRTVRQQATVLAYLVGEVEMPTQSQRRTYEFDINEGWRKVSESSWAVAE